MDTAKKRWRPKNISLLITVLLFLGLFGLGGILYNNFLSLSTFTNLLNDNAHLIIASVGVTFVLLTGGIDISIASTMAFICMFSADMLRRGLPAPVVIVLSLLIGCVAGATMGSLIHFFKLQPFIVTLAGQFFFRGMCAVVSISAIPIADSFYMNVALTKINIGRAKIYYYVFVALLVLLLALYVLRRTGFGRNVYAIGGNEQSARLMGLPVASTKVMVYTISSFCAALGGVVYSFYTLAGYPLQNVGLELNAISSAVIGGTLLTGGVGTPIGSTLGVLIQGLIGTMVTYQNLKSWWTAVTNAALLCIFIVIQRFIALRAEKAKAH